MNPYTKLLLLQLIYLFQTWLVSMTDFTASSSHRTTMHIWLCHALALGVTPFKQLPLSVVLISFGAKVPRKTGQE